MNWRPLAALGTGSLLWGYNWVVIKTAMLHAGPFEFCVHRSLVALAIMFTILAATGRPLKPVSIGWLVWLGMFQTMLWGALSCASVMTGAAGTSSVLAYTMPFWVMVLAWPILGERLAGWQWLAVVLAAVGLLLVIAPWSSESTLLSNLFATAAGMSWAVAAIIAKKMRARIVIDLWSMNAWNTLFGTLILAGLALVFPGKPTEWTGDYLFSVLYNGLGPMTLCWFFWLYALDRLVAPVAGLATLFTPVVAITCGWLLLGESPDRSELVGMLFIVSALGQLSWLGWRRERARLA